MPSAALLGEVLVERGLVNASDLESALAEQRRSKTRLGDILVGQGKIGVFTLYQAVADHAGLPYVNLLSMPPEEALLSYGAVRDYLRLRVLPWRQHSGVITLATSNPDDTLRAWAKARYGEAYRLAVTSPFDIRATVEKLFGTQMEAESRSYLHQLAPAQSARHTFRCEQQVAFALMLAGLAACLKAWPQRTLLAIIATLHVLYASMMLFKWLVFRAGLRHPPSADQYPLPEDDTLPVYTVLLPLYREKESLPRLMASIAALDYPPSLLDIKLVLEADDTETVQAAMALKPAWNIDIIRVPPSQPRTKPKALNYALRFARGEYVTVFDAEDQPDPLQLKKAVAAFRAMGGKVACLQARLNYYNAPRNLLTRWFAIEYGILFKTLLPGLQAMKIPIPLGGTSNHLALASLRAVGEWDPYNVTEDADLGVRLATHGLATMVIDSLTLEESPAAPGPWIRQRSRWIKGYMQTWLVHMRDPAGLWHAIGTKSFFGFQFFVGLASLSYLTAPAVWTLSLLAWAGVQHVRQLIFPWWIQPLAMLNLALLFVTHWVQGWHVLPRLPGYARARWRFRLALLLFPLYWVLHSIASYKSFWQLLAKPHFWEKTEHGIAQQSLT